MPWVRLDDRFPSHRKVALLSDKGFRLYVSALCWASENLTEGRILDRELKVISRIRGPKTAAAELVDAGLWERIPDGYLIHDYLEYNPDRARVKADREANAARQKAFRERKKAERDAARNAPRNGVTPAPENTSGDTNATAKRRDGDTNAEESTPEKNGHSQVNAIRNGVSNAAPSRPRPQASPTEKPASNARTNETAAIGPQIPDFARPLVDQMTTAGMVVGWRLSETEWFAVHAHIKRASVDALVEFTRRRWNPADPPQTARYLTRIWSDMPDLPAGAPTQPALPAAAGGDVVPFRDRHQQASDGLFDRAMERATARTQEPR
ncbi:hypothetical protein [Streptomyces sp. NPDC002067]